MLFLDKQKPALWPAEYDIISTCNQCRTIDLLYDPRIVAHKASQLYLIERKSVLDDSCLQ